VRMVKMAWITWLAGCAGIRDLIPEGPVLGYAERLSAFSGERASGVRYVEPQPPGPPVMPLQVFGVRYDLDLVLRTADRSTWDMHEYARVATPGGPVWLMKDARGGSLQQTIVADIPEIDAWLPEVPLERRRAEVVVEDRSTDTMIDLSLRYTNIDGKPVEVAYRGAVPESPRGKRNASTMGHSRDQVSAVLDLSHLAFARSASLRIDGVDQRLDRVLGLVPFRMVLVQTQGGFSAGGLVQATDADGRVLTTHDGGVGQAWEQHGGEGWTELVQRAPLRTLSYRFRVASDGAAELVSARVAQFGQSADALVATFSPGIPDVRRRWEGLAEGRFVLDVGGQPSHGQGRYEARWEGDGVRLTLRPTSPAWLADRPVEVTIRAVAEGGYAVRSVISR
jgi:hypothetical protein